MHALTTGGTVSALSKRYVNILTACANMQMLQRKHGGKQRLKGRVCAALGTFVHVCLSVLQKSRTCQVVSLRKQGRTISPSSYWKHGSFGAPPAWNHARRVEGSLCKCLSTGSFCHYYPYFLALRFVGTLLNCSHLSGKSSLEGKMLVDDENNETIFIVLYVFNVSKQRINYNRYNYKFYVYTNKYV